MLLDFSDWTRTGMFNMVWPLGSDCGSVGRAVASDNRDPRFESSLQEILFTINCIGKTKIKKKRPRMDHF